MALQKNYQFAAALRGCVFMTSIPHFRQIQSQSHWKYQGIHATSLREQPLPHIDNTGSPDEWMVSFIQQTARAYKTYIYIGQNQTAV